MKFITGAPTSFFRGTVNGVKGLDHDFVVFRLKTNGLKNFRITHPRPIYPSHKNQPIDSKCKSTDGLYSLTTWDLANEICLLSNCTYF